MKRFVSIATLACACLPSCIQTAQDEARIPLFVEGTDVSEPSTTDDGAEIHLDRVDLAFGPFYLCAGVSAGELCESARLEWLEAAVVDATSMERVRVGELTGVTGAVRSFMYDLGISSQLTREEPFVLEAAEALGGVSVVIEGRAELDDRSIDFRAALPIRQGPDTEQGVPVVRSRTRAIVHDVTGHEAGLVVHFDPRPWVDGIDFGDATEDELVIEADTQAYRSIRNAILAGPRPELEWLPERRE